MKSLFFATMLMISSTAFGAFENTFFDEASVPTTIDSVHVEIFDMARTDLGCSSSVCFRMEVFINDILVARWATSPGNPDNNAGFNGVNTPKYTNRSFDKNRFMGSGYVSSRGDAMPYAMFILDSKGKTTGFAVHAGVVTGEKESHGCVRLEYNNAKTMNAWVKAAKKNGGSITITTNHTND